MDSESKNDTVFKEYRNLEPKGRSLEQYLVLFFHLAAAFLISAIQLLGAPGAWYSGFGVATPLLLIAHGYIYSSLANDSWYRNQMVPFILSVAAATEKEKERYLQYHRRIARFWLIPGWLIILLCQIAWTFGFSRVIHMFVGDDFLIRLLYEFAACFALLGLLLLYALALILMWAILSHFLQSRYQDIKYLSDIENRWEAENRRRAKDLESVKKKHASADSQYPS